MTVRRSLGWTAIGQAIYFVVQFGASVILARLLTPAEMGVFAVGMAILGLIGSIEAFGLTALVIREPDLDDETVATAFTLNLVICIVISAATFLLSGPAGAFFKESEVTRVMAPIAIAPLLNALEFRPLALLQRNMRFGPVAAVAATKALVTAAVTVFFAFRGHSYMSLAWGMLAGACSSVLLSNVLGWRHASLRLSTRNYTRLVHFGVQMLAIAGLSNVATRCADLICGRLLGLAALGVYSRAANLTNALFNDIHVIASKVMFADFAKRLREEGSLRGVYLRTLEFSTAVLWPMFAGIAVLARPTVNWLYGENWRAAAGPLSLLCLATMALLAASMAWEVFVVRNETKRQVRIEAVRTGVGLVLFSLGCLAGLAAAAAARLLEACIAFALYRPHLARLTDTTWKDLTWIFGRSGLLTALAVGPAIAVMEYLGWPFSPPPLLVAGGVVAGMLVWLAGLRVMKHPVYDEIVRFVGKRNRPVAS